MENENSENVEERISLDDAEIVVKIIEKALTFRDWVKDAVIGADFDALTEEQKSEELRTPRVDKFYFGKVPCLFVRFVGDENFIASVIFMPIEAGYSFLTEARRFRQKWRNEKQTDEEVENLAFEDAVDMFLIMLDSIYKRGMLMLESFTNETIAQWHHTNYRRFLRNNIAVGNKIQPISYNAVNQAVDDYAKDLKTHWQQHGQSEENGKKIQLFEEYERIHDHWKMIRMVYRNDGNWRGYAKTSGFEDTWDDLLDKLENLDPTKLCQLAMEHAARRVGFVKQTGVSESALEKRRNGIPVTDYTYQQLKDFENEGKELTLKLEQIREFEQNRDFVQVKNRKLVEQNLESVKDER